MAEAVVCEFVVEGRAASRGSKRAFRTKSGKINLVDGKNSYKYMANISQAAKVAMNGKPPVNGPVILYWVAAFSRPKSHYRSNGELKANAPEFFTGTPDCSKVVRAVEDAMSKIVYLDDKQIIGYSPCINKIYTSGSPFTFIRVSRVESAN